MLKAKSARSQKRRRRTMAKAGKRQPISADLCFYCRQPMAENSDDPPSLEHLVSLSRGGGNQLRNIRLAHRLCNIAVGDLPKPIKLRLAGQMPRGRLPDWVRTELAADPTYVWPAWLGKRPAPKETTEPPDPLYCAPHATVA